MTAAYKDAPKLVEHPMGRGIEPLQVLLGSTRHRAKSSTADCKLTAACQEREPNSHQLGIQPCFAFRSLPTSAEVIIHEDFDPRLHRVSAGEHAIEGDRALVCHRS